MRLADLRDEVDACDGSPAELAKLPRWSATLDEALRSIGAALATYEMKLVLGTVQRRLSLQNDGADWMVRRSVTMGPKRGAPLRCIARRAGADAP